MTKNQEPKKNAGQPAAWETPSLQRVGHVGDVFQMPGGGKLSANADDTGDLPKKPKGQG